tara:strand:- start:803 stop:955 length:153 start_codon:yes stop_codon:yes gene_type:complete
MVNVLSQLKAQAAQREVLSDILYGDLRVISDRPSLYSPKGRGTLDYLLYI